ncbi:hypothetical protein AMTRI_Chr02g260010 [Amborella trichopoda]
MLRIRHKQQCLLPSVGPPCMLCANRRWQYLSPPAKVHYSPFRHKQQCPALSKGHDTVTPRLWTAMLNATKAFLLLRLALSLCSLLFSFLPPFLLD